MYAITANRASALIFDYIKMYNKGTWLVPVNVCPDIPLTFHLANVNFEFVDINPNTLCLDEETCYEKLSSGDCYAGVLFVRTYGCIVDVQSFFDKCRTINPNIKIIDDRCLCIPERQPLFNNADLILYSTGHCKPIDLGGGGMGLYKEDHIVNFDTDLYYDGTDEEAIYKVAMAKDMVLEIIPKGWLKIERYKEYEEYIEVINSRIKQVVEHRNIINAIYESELPKEIQLDKCFQNWRFNILLPDSSLKEKVLSRLFENGLFASNHYRSANRLFDDNIFVNSDQLHSRVINLFNDFHYSEEQTIKTTKIIKSTL